MPLLAFHIEYSPNGLTYAIVRKNKVLFYDYKGQLFCVIKNDYYHKSNPQQNKSTIYNKFEELKYEIVNFAYILHDLIAIGDLTGMISVYDLDSKQCMFQLHGDISKPTDTTTTTSNTHVKLRGLKVCNLNENTYLVSADNQGKISVYDINDCLNRIVKCSGDNDNNDDNDDSDNDNKQVKNEKKKSK